jgi:superfamily II DNA or RNA helicase
MRFAKRVVVHSNPKTIRFDRGTLELGPGAPDVPRCLWDPRTETRRVAAHRFSDLVTAAESAGIEIEGDLRSAWVTRPRDVRSLDLRAYQAQALASWAAFAHRGVVTLPTGAGKTRVAIAAIFETGLPTAVLCPTRALAVAWVDELKRQLDGEAVGLVGDGQRAVERVTVLTFESAFRHMDQLGDRFGLLVVDEAHHFGSGARVEALEASAAVARLGLTATAPDAGSEAAARLESLIGPVVFEMGYGDLVGKYLAPVSIVRIPVRLELDESAEYEAKTRVFLEMRRTFMRLYPGSDVATLLRGLGRTPDGRRALRDRARALELASFPRAKRSLLRTLLERHRADRTIVFTAFAENAYVAAKDNLVPVITAETAAGERQEILTAFRDGKLRAIASARVLNEGIDVPEARVAIIVAGVLGAREHIQRIGRVLRPGPEKHALVYELFTTNTSDATRSRMRAQYAPQSSPRT